MKIDHVGYAVKRIDKAMMTFSSLGYSFSSIVDDIGRNVQIAFGAKDRYRIELVSPLDRTKESPVDNYLSRVKGTPYHICYESEDFDREIEKMKKDGFKVVIEPAESIAFKGRRVAFMMHINIGLLEIVER